jgi:predicted RNase H-like HicB family nuclease
MTDLNQAVKHIPTKSHESLLLLRVVSKLHETCRTGLTYSIQGLCLRGLILKQEFHVIIERDNAGFYVGSVPEQQGCHTQARSLDILMKRIREAVELCLEVRDARFGTAE